MNMGEYEARRTPSVSFQFWGKEGINHEATSHGASQVAQ